MSKKVNGVENIGDEYSDYESPVRDTIFSQAMIIADLLEEIACLQAKKSK